MRRRSSTRSRARCPIGVLAGQRRPATAPCASASPQCSTAQRPPGGGVVREATSPAASTRRIARAHAGAGGHRRRRPGAGRPPRPAPAAASTPARQQHGVGRPASAFARPDAPGRRRRARSGSARCPQQLARPAPPASRRSARRPRPSRAAWGSASARDQRDRAPRAASDAAASQPMKPEPTTATRAPWRRSAPRRPRSVRMQDARIVGAGDRRARRLAPRSPARSASKSSCSPSSVATRAGGQVERRGRGAPPQADPVSANQRASSIGSSCAAASPRRYSLVSGGRR